MSAAPRSPGQSPAPADRDRLKAHLQATMARDAAGHVTSGAFANAVKGRVPV
ncbi:MAG TPA: hypothetical protein VJR47_06050 [Stellaceae bacterium]|nr:hypothetical protein [Stellaceae bacterium]